MTSQTPSVPVSVTDSTIVSCYEELRRQALRPADGVMGGSGLALLVRQGMKSWIKAWWQCAASTQAKPPIKTGLEEVPPMQGNREVVRILASMALGGHRQEARQ